jgi:hypothetical protein
VIPAIKPVQNYALDLSANSIGINALTPTYYIRTALINSMEQRSSSEANSFSATQEIPRISWIPEVHYRIHKSAPPLPILNQLNLVHDPIPLLEDLF